MLRIVIMVHCATLNAPYLLLATKKSANGTVAKANEGGNPKSKNVHQEGTPKPVCRVRLVSEHLHQIRSSLYLTDKLNQPNLLQIPAV